MFAYIGRYGHQPLGEMRRMTLRELGRMSAQLAAIVEEENKPQRRTDY